jgi:peptide-methionine (S)-S-oxide reductase
MADSTLLDELFREAVAGIDAGDEAALRRTIDAYPRLLSDRLDEPGEWLRAQVGDALDGFFRAPYLLWFVAEDPVRTGRLSPNIAQLARVIVDAAQRQRVPGLQTQLDYALQLVSWSTVAAECGVQVELLDLLLDAGASPATNPDSALVNGNFAAAEHLVARGAPLTLGAALCLGRWDAVDRLTDEASGDGRQFAFVLAALNGKADALKWLIEHGVELNAPSKDLYSHATPLHHAVSSGIPEAVRILVEAGADRDIKDSAYSGTPLGWAEYCAETSSGDRLARYTEIAGYLREKADSARAGEAE